LCTVAIRKSMSVSVISRSRAQQGRPQRQPRRLRVIAQV
jgi:hypothetical protein